MKNLKKFGAFIFISNFAKLLIEVFIPILLFKLGFSYKEIILFLLFKSSFILLLIFPCIKLGEKIKYKKLILISNIFFLIFALILNIKTHSNLFLIAIAFFDALYLILYWIGRHFLTLNIIPDKKTTDVVSRISIISLFSSLPAGITGAFILDHLGYMTLSIVVFIILLLSNIPLMFIQEKKEKKGSLNLKHIVKSFPKNNYLNVFFDQIRLNCVVLFPLFIYLYVDKSIKYIGVLNLITCISSIIFVYLLAKFMDKNKKDYLRNTALLLATVWLFKLNVNAYYVFMIIIFFEGIFKTGLDMIFSRNIYSIGREYNKAYFILFIEGLNALFRIVILSIVLVFGINLKLLLYIGVFSVVMMGLIKFNDGKNGY